MWPHAGTQPVHCRHKTGWARCDLNTQSILGASAGRLDLDHGSTLHVSTVAGQVRAFYIPPRAHKIHPSSAFSARCKARSKARSGSGSGLPIREPRQSRANGSAHLSAERSLRACFDFFMAVILSRSQRCHGMKLESPFAIQQEAICGLLRHSAGTSRHPPGSAFPRKASPSRHDQPVRPDHTGAT